MNHRLIVEDRNFIKLCPSATHCICNCCRFAVRTIRLPITVWSLLSDLAQRSWMDKWTETCIPTRWRMCQVLFPSTSWVASYHFKHIVQWYMYWCLFVNGITVHCFGKFFCLLHVFVLIFFFYKIEFLSHWAVVMAVK